MNLENGQMYISKLSSMQLESYMRVSSGTVQALQIFQEDYHPNVIKGRSHTIIILLSSRRSTHVSLQDPAEARRVSLCSLC